MSYLVISDTSMIGGICLSGIWGYSDSYGYRYIAYQCLVGMATRSISLSVGFFIVNLAHGFFLYLHANYKHFIGGFIFSQL